MLHGWLLLKNGMEVTDVRWVGRKERKAVLQRHATARVVRREDVCVKTMPTLSVCTSESGR